jgi:8-oxo-dGTP diphosphatase
MKNTHRYESGSIAVDAVICTIKDETLLVYLNSREKDPYKGMFELPGGLLLQDESAEEALGRKLEDVLGLQEIFFQQFHTFTQPDRDPRGRTISIGFIALVAQDQIRDHNYYYPVDQLPRMAFDHKEIIDKAVVYLKENLDNQLVRQFMPQFFPLNDLQKVYEVLGQKSLDNRNFRKKVLVSGIVKKASKVQKDVPHRPASLYIFSPK